MKFEDNDGWCTLVSSRFCLYFICMFNILLPRHETSSDIICHHEEDYLFTLSCDGTFWGPNIGF